MPEYMQPVRIPLETKAATEDKVQAIHLNYLQYSTWKSQKIKQQASARDGSGVGHMERVLAPTSRKTSHVPPKSSGPIKATEKW